MLACRHWWWLMADRCPASQPVATVSWSLPTPLAAVLTRPMTVLLMRWRPWRIRRRPLWSPLIETWLAGFGGMVLWLLGPGHFVIGWTVGWSEPEMNTFTSSAGGLG